MNYYEHHLGDYMRDTAHLSVMEDGVYRRLLDQYYVRERPLPVEIRECCKLARAASKPERDAVAYVMREFFDLCEDGHHQPRADAEIARFQDKQRKAKASADARWSHSERNAIASATFDANGMRTHSEGNATRERASERIRVRALARPQSPDTSNEKTLPQLEGFGEFWAAYPRKVDKADAEKAWRKLGYVNGLLPTILAAVKAQCVEGGTLGTEPRFIPHAASWLNGKRWEDVLTSSVQGGTPDWVTR